MIEKEIIIDFCDKKSIKKAERQKLKLENEGYKLMNTISTDWALNEYILIYQKD